MRSRLRSHIQKKVALPLALAYDERPLRAPLIWWRSLKLWWNWILWLDTTSVTGLEPPITRSVKMMKISPCQENIFYEMTMFRQLPTNHTYCIQICTFQRFLSIGFILCTIVYHCRNMHLNLLHKWANFMLSRHKFESFHSVLTVFQTTKSCSKMFFGLIGVCLFHINHNRKNIFAYVFTIVHHLWPHIPWCT